MGFKVPSEGSWRIHCWESLLPYTRQPSQSCPAQGFKSWYGRGNRDFPLLGTLNCVPNISGQAAWHREASDPHTGNLFSSSCIRLYNQSCLVQGLKSLMRGRLFTCARLPYQCCLAWGLNPQQKKLKAPAPLRTSASWLGY